MKHQQLHQFNHLQQQTDNSSNSNPINSPLNHNIQLNLIQSQKSPSLIKIDVLGLKFIVIFFTAIFIIICSAIFIKENNQDFLSEIIYKNDKIKTRQIYQLVKLNSSSALCLDGSPASYYISQTGDPQKILIFFQSGGWCGGQTDQITIENCYQRSTTNSGSSKYYAQTFQFNDNILAKNQENYFKNWKKVIFTYCDGSGYQGTKKQPVKYKNSLIYFRGHNITIQRLQDLNNKFQLFSKASKVVLTGWSAGGLATYTWANYLGQKVKNGKVFAIPDAGVFPDAQNVVTNEHQFKASLTNLMKLSNTQIDPPNPECMKQFPNQKQNCMFAKNLHKHIKVPLFVVESLYDWWSINFVLGIRCDLKTSQSCNSSEKKLIQQVREYKINLLQQIVKNPKNGAWGYNCLGHGVVGSSRYMNKKLSVPQNSKNSINKSIGNWIQKFDKDKSISKNEEKYKNYEYLTSNRKDIHIDDMKWHISRYCG